MEAAQELGKAQVYRNVAMTQTSLFLIYLLYISSMPKVFLIFPTAAEGSSVEFTPLEIPPPTKTVNMRGMWRFSVSVVEVCWCVWIHS